MIQRDDGQMTIELCIALPVLIIVAVIAFNALTFFSECAKFDRLGRNAVVTQAATTTKGGSSTQMAANILSSIESEINGQIVVEASGYDSGDGGVSDALSYATFRLTYEYSPTLFGIGMRDRILGVSMPKLKHTITLAVDTYTPGKWVWSFVN